MDFLAAIQKKVQEMEEQARLLQTMEEQMGEQKRRQAGKQQKDKRQKQQRNKGPSQTTPQSRSLVSREETFQTPHCATEGTALSSPSGGVAATLRPRLVDDLHGRLDEAFLLSEILGRPRCERGWPDD